MTLVRNGDGGSENRSVVLDGALPAGSVKRDELGFAALCRRALCRRWLGYGGRLLRGSPGGRHLGGRPRNHQSSHPRPRPSPVMASF